MENRILRPVQKRMYKIENQKDEHQNTDNRDLIIRPYIPQRILSRHSLYLLLFRSCPFPQGRL